MSEQERSINGALTADSPVIGSMQVSGTVYGNLFLPPAYRNVRTFDTVADMQDASDLTDGAVCHTLGFHAVDDGGAAWYKVSASGTANGMDIIECGNLYANLIVDGVHNVRQYGAYGDDQHNDSGVFSHVFGKLADESIAMYVPAGDYIVDPKSMQVGNGHSCEIYGDGFISKLAIPDGSVDSDYSTMFSFTGSSRTICIHDLRIDMNHSHNESSGYDWQHSAAIYMYPQNGSTFSCSLHHLWFNDLIADGILCGGSDTRCFDKILIDSIYSVGKTGTRSCICLTGCWHDAVISNCEVCRIETEINAYNASYECQLEIVNCIVSQALDLDQKAPSPVRNQSTACHPVHVSNSTFALSDVNYGVFMFGNCNVTLNSHVRFAYSELFFDGCEVTLSAQYAQGVNTGFYSESNGSEGSIHFRGCDVKILSPISIGFVSCVGDSNVGSYDQSIEFSGCSIVTVAPIIRARTGNVTFRDNKVAFVGTGDPITLINYGSSNLNADCYAAIYNNKVKGDGVYIVSPPIAGKKLTLYMHDNVTDTLGALINFTRYDKIDSLRGGSGSNVRVVQIDDLYSDAVPTTGKYVKGQKVWNTNPSSGEPIGWIANSNGAASAGRFTAMANL